MARDGAVAGALVISLDFELHWGVRDKWPLAQCRNRLLGAREAVPAMLRLFRDFEIHATWATVGLLFFDGKREMLDGLPSRRPAYAQSAFSAYAELPAVGANEKDDPFHFAPSLIRHIAETPGQEIGTHTFSHYYCLEDGQSPADFRDDLRAAVRVARRKLARAPRSIVFPRNQVSAPHLEVCRDLGFVAYRGNPETWPYRARPDEAESLVRRGVRLADAYLPLTGRAGHPRVGSSAPVNVPASRHLRPYNHTLRHLERLRLDRIRSDLEHAARHRRLLHLWWHPHDFGLHLAQNLQILREILNCFAGLRDACGMESLTMEEAAKRAMAAWDPAEQVGSAWTGLAGSATR